MVQSLVTSGQWSRVEQSGALWPCWPCHVRRLVMRIYSTKYDEKQSAVMSTGALWSSGLITGLMSGGLQELWWWLHMKNVTKLCQLSALMLDLDLPDQTWDMTLASNFCANCSSELEHVRWEDECSTASLEFTVSRNNGLWNRITHWAVAGGGQMEVNT